MNEGEDFVATKIFYAIGEVAALTGMKSHILRYWESEFPILRPQKLSNGRRAYRAADIQLILTIKRLLYEEGYTIAGARKKVAEERRRGGAPDDGKEIIRVVRRDLREILRLLKQGRR